MQRQNQRHRPAEDIFRRLAFSGLAAGACRQQYWQRNVAGMVARSVAHAVAGRVARTQHWAGRLTGLSAGARQPGCSARAVALWSNNHAVCCGRSQKNPHDHCSIHPQPSASAHSALSWAPRCSGLKTGPEGKLACGRSAKAFPLSPGARTAPDHRPIHSLRSFITRPVVRRAARGERSTASVAPGGAPSSVARWGSLLLLRGSVQSARGRFLLLGPPGGVPSPHSGPGGPARMPAWGQGDACQNLKPRVACECSATNSRGFFQSGCRLRALTGKAPAWGQQHFSNATFIQSRKEMLCLCLRSRLLSNPTPSESTLTRTPWNGSRTIALSPTGTSTQPSAKP